MLLQPHVTKGHKPIFDIVKPLSTKLVHLCKGIIDKQDYEAMNVSIFKNAGESNGQPLHADYDCVHDNMCGY